ncbi:hypothetical protein ACOSP7_021332 [Xanthoceras sorbifolium]
MTFLFFLIHFLFLLLSLFRFLAFAYAAQTANVTVALNGMDDFRSIGEAVSAVPNNSESCFYIYVKKRIYKEHVYFGPEKRNVTLFGDGINQTIITSNRSTHSGYDIRNFAALNFVFGDAAVVIQNSYIHVRLPREGQENVITTDERYQETNNTAIVIHNCSIIPTSELKNKSHVKTYLGWIKFDNQSDIPALHYAEYRNYGQGSSIGSRVKWPGYHILDNPNDIRSFNG